MSAFNQYRLDDYLQQNNDKIKSRIESESDDFILNVNEQTYVDYLTDEFSVEPMKLDFDNTSVSQREREVSGSSLGGYFVDPYKTYKKQEVTFHISCSQNAWTLIKYQPNPHRICSIDAYVEDNCVCFDILNLDERNPNYLKHESNQIITH